MFQLTAASTMACAQTTTAQAGHWLALIINAPTGLSDTQSLPV